MSVYQRDIIGYAIILILASSLYFWGIPTYSPEFPGYGVPASFMPNIAAIGMAVLSILGLFQTYKKQNKKEKAAKTNWLHLIKFFLPCLLLMPAMTAFGYILSGIIFLLIIQLLCGQRKLVWLFLVSVLPVTGFYVLMVYALGVPLP